MRVSPPSLLIYEGLSRHEGGGQEVNLRRQLKTRDEERGPDEHLETRGKEREKRVQLGGERENERVC